MLPSVQYLTPVYEDVDHPYGVLVGVLVGRTVSDLVRIEDHDVCEKACFQVASVVDPEISGRE